MTLMYIGLVIQALKTMIMYKVSMALAGGMNMGNCIENYGFPFEISGKKKWSATPPIKITSYFMVKTTANMTATNICGNMRIGLKCSLKQIGTGKPKDPPKDLSYGKDRETTTTAKDCHIIDDYYIEFQSLGTYSGMKYYAVKGSSVTTGTDSNSVVNLPNYNTAAPTGTTFKYYLGAPYLYIDPQSTPYSPSYASSFPADFEIVDCFMTVATV